MLEPINYPSISVVIPSFNQGEYIEETILSVIGQEYPKLEIIIIDGGSTDNTVEIIKKYAHKISYWHSKPDKGQADAINQGMRLSSGEVLCWLNSDDMYLPGALLDIGRKFAGLTEQNYLIYGITMILKQDSSRIHSVYHPIIPFEQFSLTYNDFIAQPSAFWTRKLWQSTGELNLNYNYVLDWDWFIRASKITKFDYVPKVYAIYRNHSINKTNNGAFARRKEISEVVTKYSSDYWSKLYIEVERYYPKIAEFINESKLPKRSLLLPFLFPKLGFILKNVQDLYTVLTMYG
jgi:glycosyltransferase involved in cell wall biosynthesis